jgi:hypothetical protein
MYVYLYVYLYVTTNTKCLISMHVYLYPISDKYTTKYMPKDHK